ncbi:MAG: DegT/DnrJ/EryC1/StrS aminotransferase family protein [Ignavibacteriales bacterium]|nr:DegT/DnrJ/EryC1/StrS aminotransferase family protein [Ignavibacteriales bacterium]
MAIPFIDLKAQQSRIKASIDRRIAKLLEHGTYIMGPEVAELEKTLSSYVGVKHCVSCSSGTDALLMPLMAYGMGPGDVIFTTPFTFIATAEVIAILRAKTVFVDIDERTYNIDPARLEDAVKRYAANPSLGKIRGVIPVDLFGQTPDYDAIKTIADRYGLWVMEDAAQAFGASYKGKKSCSFGDVAATSFFPAKPLGCYGDGGAIFTNSDEMHKALVSIRVHGQGEDKYNNVRVGINGRLDTMQAAILLAKMEIFDEEIGLRNQVADRYSKMLQPKYVTPYVAPDCVSAWAQYSILAENRADAMAKLKAANIPSAVYYPKPLHLQDAFKELGGKKGDFPLSERIAEKIFSIPMHPYLTAEDQAMIVQALMQ